MGTLLDVFFPSLCFNCRQRRRVKLGLCSACLSQVEFTGLSACIRCGRYCLPGHCAPVDHGYSRVLSLAAYRGPWRRVVQTVKFGRGRGLALELARELAEQQDAAGFARPRAVVPVPTAGKSQGAYALNPLICGELAKAAGTVVHRVLGRRPGRPPQVELDFRGRLEGLEDYIFFSGGTRYSGATLWLVDDVYTTGTTADVCAQVLLSAGAASVYLLVLAS